MKVIRNSTLAAHGLMFAAAGAVLCGFVIANSPAAAGAAEPAAPPSAEVTDEIIIRAPNVVRRPLPRTGPGTPPGLANPEIISLSSTVSYADLDFSRAEDVIEMETRIRDTARDVCEELNRRYPRQSTQYVYTNTDCVRKATDDGLEVFRQITAAIK
jgi:UrcA family protein